MYCQYATSAPKQQIKAVCPRWLKDYLLSFEKRRTSLHVC